MKTIANCGLRIAELKGCRGQGAVALCGCLGNSATPKRGDASQRSFQSEFRIPNSEIARIRNGFTLIELMVVIGIILLIAATALPSIIGMLTSGADRQAVNYISSQLTAARAHAIRNNTYAGVHFQYRVNGGMGDYYMMVVEGTQDETTGDWTFKPPEGFQPRRLPGKMACGGLDGAYVNASGNYIDDAFATSSLPYFTSFTIVFAPNGSAVKSVNGQEVKFDASHAAFSGSTKLWDIDVANRVNATASVPGDGESPVTALVLFDYPAFFGSDATDSEDRASYLNLNGQFVPVNVYTGQLLPRD
jgi:prepilin-type N-terminal cleavage/methylation domain-containing protein